MFIFSFFSYVLSGGALCMELLTPQVCKILVFYEDMIDHQSYLHIILHNKKENLCCTIVFTSGLCKL